MGKILKIGLAWGLCIVAYLLLAFIYPALTGLFDQSASGVLAASPGAETTYPGFVQSINLMALIVWFIPGGICILATVLFLREES